MYSACTNAACQRHVKTKASLCNRHTAQKPCDLYTLMSAFLAARAWTRSALSSFVLRAPKQDHFCTLRLMPHVGSREATCGTCGCTLAVFVNTIGHYLSVPVQSPLVSGAAACMEGNRLPHVPQEKDLRIRLVGFMTVTYWHVSEETSLRASSSSTGVHACVLPMLAG